MQIERAKSQPDQQLQGAIGHRAAAEEPSGRIQAETQRMDRRMGVEQHQIRVVTQRPRQLFRLRAGQVRALVHFFEDRDAATNVVRRKQLRDPA